MRPKKNKNVQIPKLGQRKVLTVDEYLNAYFERVDYAQGREEDFFKSYIKWLEDQREKRIGEITDSLIDVATTTVEGTFCRIVDLKYVNDPLCVYGSTLLSGRRFNIGDGISHYKPFHSLYIADNDDTAHCEKFHYPRQFTKGNLSSSEFGLRKNYACFEVEVSLSKCIDITDKNSLKSFSEIISKIKPSREILEFAHAVGIPTLRTVQTPGELLKTLLNPEFLKHPTALEMPANSQWFGLYCLRAGIQGIIYPSVRKSGGGKNIAVLIDNFSDTASFARLNADTEVVHESRREMNSKNLHFFKIPVQKTLTH